MCTRAGALGMPEYTGLQGPDEDAKYCILSLSTLFNIRYLVILQEEW